MSKAACKEIIDGKGARVGQAHVLVDIHESMAQSLGFLGVAETPAGDKWLDTVIKFQTKEEKILADLITEAMALCNSQPLA